MVVFLVVVALAFDFMNGFHDAANSIATILKNAAHATASCGFSTPVETTVAIEFAAS